MKTTLELPDQSLRKAKMLAASQGISLKALFSEALDEKLQRAAQQKTAEKPWMEGFGKLSDLADGNREILAIIEEEFEFPEPGDIR